MFAIYNDVIATTTAIYTEEQVEFADYRARVEQRSTQGFPTLVALADAELLGFGTFGEFRAWPCYALTVEHSLHVAREHRGRGVGRVLLSALCDEVSRHGKHVMIGGIDADNAASLHLHESLGFARVGLLREVGRKFGRWLDLTFVQRTFG